MGSTKFDLGDRKLGRFAENSGKQNSWIDRAEKMQKEKGKPGGRTERLQKWLRQESEKATQEPPASSSSGSSSAAAGRRTFKRTSTSPTGTVSHWSNHTTACQLSPACLRAALTKLVTCGTGLRTQDRRAAHRELGACRTDENRFFWKGRIDGTVTLSWNSHSAASRRGWRAAGALQRRVLGLEEPLNRFFGYKGSSHCFTLAVRISIHQERGVSVCQTVTPNRRIFLR